MTGVLGKDIQLEDGDLQFSTSQNFRIVSDEANLAQAIETRLYTVQGEYYNNSLYGSKLSNTVGKKRNDITKNEMKGYIVEALKQEPRIESVEEILITFNEDNSVTINLKVLPINSTTYLNLVYPLFTEFA